jgi:hypothetical protein
MSVFSKILIVVQAILVMVYLGANAALFQHRRDWRESYGDLKRRYHEMTLKAVTSVSKAKAIVNNREAFLDTKSGELSSLNDNVTFARDELGQVSANLATRQENLRKLLDERAELRSVSNSRENNVTSLRNTNDKLEIEIKENRERKQIAEKQVARLNTVTLNLDADINDIRREYSDVRSRLREKSLLIAMIEERGVNFATLLAGPPARLVKGRVSAVKNDMSPSLVVIDVGADDRVEIGYTFSVIRGSQFIAKLIVERAEPTASACRVHFAAEGQSVQPGDEVTTRLP